MSSEKSRENRLRRKLWAQGGYLLRKSRAGFGIDNLGGYAIIHNGVVVAGARFDLELDDVEQFITENHAEGPEA